MIFADRQHAGWLLGGKLAKYKNENPIILGLPLGGVPVAAEIATLLNAPLEVIIVRRIGSYFNPELAVGAICEDEEPFWKENILARVGLEPFDLGGIVKQETNKIHQQIAVFRRGRKLPSFRKHTVIIVDDGLTTGVTAAAAVRYIKKKGAARVVVAAPVAAVSSVRMLRPKVDELVVLNECEDLLLIGLWYMDFSRVSDEEVSSLLNQNRVQDIHYDLPAGR